MHRNKTRDGAGVGGWLHLAASPTFATMALLTIFASNPMDMLCPAHGMSPLNGMTTMYLLMSAFHAGPWLKWVARWRGGRSRAGTFPRPD
jgi:hypothetical protein